MLHRSKRTTATLSYPAPMTLALADPNVGDKLTDTIKDTRGLDVERFLAELAEALGVEWNREVEARHADDLLMGWDQVRALGVSGELLETVAQPDAQGQKLLRDAAETMRLTARGYHRVLRVARTLADLDGTDKIGRLHLAEALSYRALADDVRRAA